MQFQQSLNGLIDGAVDLSSHTHRTAALCMAHRVLPPLSIYIVPAAHRARERIVASKIPSIGGSMS